MATGDQGANAEIQISGVEFAEDSSGTSDISYATARNNSPINGGRGSMVNQLGRYEQRDLSFSTDDNAAHNPVLRGAHHQTVPTVYKKNGSGTGLESQTFNAVAALSLIHI